jgi:Ca-activated chloride channel homolog
MEIPVFDRHLAFNASDDDFRFAAAVASFGMILRDSPHKGLSSLSTVLEAAEASTGRDPNGHRMEFIQLVRKAQALPK